MKTRVSSVTPLELLAIIKNFNIVCKLSHWKAENLHLFIFSLLQTRTTKARLKLLQDFLKWCSEIIHIKAVEIFQFTSTECLRFSWSHFSLSMTIHGTAGITLSALPLCVAEDSTGTLAAFPGALLTRSLLGTFAGCKRKLLLLH